MRGSGRRSNFSISGNEIDLWLAGGTYCVNHFGQPVQRLWAKDHIYIGCTVANCSAFLAGNTATNANNQLRVGLFEFTPASQLGKTLFLGFFTDGAGIKQDDVGFCGVAGGNHGLLTSRSAMRELSYSFI